MKKIINFGLLLKLRSFIKQNKHLPEIASAKEMVKEGINIGEMNVKLLQKIEELTLYLINQSKDIDLLKQENVQQQKEIEVLRAKK